MVSRWAHIPEIGGSNPLSATKHNQKRLDMRFLTRYAFVAMYKNDNTINSIINKALRALGVQLSFVHGNPWFWGLFLLLH